MMNNTLIKEFPLPIAGGNNFGRYAKISTAETFNMMTSDKALVPYPGYKKVNDMNGGGEGRGLYTSSKYNHMIAVIDNNVFNVSADNSISLLFQLATESGDVYISENDASEIGIVDGLNLYIFNYTTNIPSIYTSTQLGFLPSYLDFQDSYFISTGIAPGSATNTFITNQWYLSDNNNGSFWPQDAQHVGELQTKPDVCVATVNFNRQLFIFGKKVTEVWVNVGYTLFPYQRNNYFSVNYGCLNPATIATGDIIVGDEKQLIPLICWLGSNEKSGPTIMYSMGGQPCQLTDDGINYRIEQLRHPENCYGFIFKLAGHTFYQIVWPLDNLSFAFDFNERQFYTVTDENLNYHIAKRVAFFNNKYYFLSINDGGLYEMGNNFYTYDYSIGNFQTLDTSLVKEIPRIRKLPPFALPNSDPFVVNYVDITMQQGETELEQAIDISLSVDGGITYGNTGRSILNLLPNRINKFREYDLGQANDFRMQFRLWGFHNFVLTQGVLGVYQ